VKNNFAKKPAFTLLELLIVITIVGLLTSVLVFNFRGVKERQEVLNMADQTVAMLQTARADVRAGKITEGGIYVCEGAFFTTLEKPFFVVTEYNSDEGCKIEDALKSSYGISSGSAYVDSILLDLADVSPAYVLFAPPEAQVYFYNESGLLSSENANIVFSSSAFNDYKIQMDVLSAGSTVSLNVNKSDADE